jgi:hypothetical protein
MKVFEVMSGECPATPIAIRTTPNADTIIAAMLVWIVCINVAKFGVWIDDIKKREMKITAGPRKKAPSVGFSSAIDASIKRFV